MTRRCLAGVVRHRSGEQVGKGEKPRAEPALSLPSILCIHLPSIKPLALGEGAEGETSSFALSYFCLATFFQQSSF